MKRSPQCHYHTVNQSGANNFKYEENMYKQKHLLTLLILLCGCTTSSITPTVSTPQVIQVISQQDIFDIMPNRIEKFENKLIISIDLEGLDVSSKPDDLLDSHIIDLLVSFKNVSLSPIVLRMPITIGTDGLDGTVNDLTAIFSRRDGSKMSVEGISNYPNRLNVRNDPPVTHNNFIILDTGESLAMPIEIAIPLVYIEYNNYSGKLPSGEYNLSIAYRNIDIGYKVSYEKTPPVTFESLQSEDKWYFENTLFADLDAWVGLVQSNTIQFAIP